MRRESKRIKVGDIAIGGGERVTVQSMLSAPPSDIEKNLSQARALVDAGCDILRTAVPDAESVKLISLLKNEVDIPVVADIHFDYRLAIECAAAGADKIRINPGNIGSDEKVKAVADACRAKGVPIRIGVNSGSVERHILAKYGGPTPAAMVESAMYHASLLEKYDFTDILISIKSGGVPAMLEAYRRCAEICDYPLHLGVTHAGAGRMGLIKSAMGIGALLMEGIGDTIRVSLTSPDPTDEIRAANDILRAAGITSDGAEVISCPTCGRTSIDVVGLADEVSRALEGCPLPITVAVMGCAVNGPGEAREADLGVSGGNGTGILFSKGKVLKKVPEGRILSALLEQVEILKEERKNAGIL